MSRFSDALGSCAASTRDLIDWLKTSARPDEVAICTVHGNTDAYTGDFAERYAWPRLQLAQLRRHTSPGFKIFAFGNQIIPEHAAFLRDCPEVELFTTDDTRHGKGTHVWRLRNWLMRKAIRSHRVIVHLDSDAFPVRDDWLARTVSSLSYRSPMVAVQRRENGDTHADRCFLAFNRPAMRQHSFDFSTVGVVDAGGAISETLEATGFQWKAMLRSNRHDYHPLIAGLYDDMIYHHAAGSREPGFRMNFPQIIDQKFFSREKVIHRALMKRVFDHTDAFLAELRGQVEPIDIEATLVCESEEAR